LSCVGRRGSSCGRPGKTTQAWESPAANAPGAPSDLDADVVVSARPHCGCPIPTRVRRSLCWLSPAGKGQSPGTWSQRAQPSRRRLARVFAYGAPLEVEMTYRYAKTNWPWRAAAVAMGDRLKLLLIVIWSMLSPVFSPCFDALRNWLSPACATHRKAHRKCRCRSIRLRIGFSSSFACFPPPHSPSENRDMPCLDVRGRGDLGWNVLEIDTGDWTVEVMIVFINRDLVWIRDTGRREKERRSRWYNLTGMTLGRMSDIKDLACTPSMLPAGSGLPQIAVLDGT